MSIGIAFIIGFLLGVILDQLYMWKQRKCVAKIYPPEEDVKPEEPEPKGAERIYEPRQIDPYRPPEWKVYRPSASSKSLGCTNTGCGHAFKEGERVLVWAKFGSAGRKYDLFCSDCVEDTDG